MFEMTHTMLRAWAAAAASRLKAARKDDRGTAVETVVIAGGLAVIALGVIAALTMLVNNKLASISL